MGQNHPDEPRVVGSGAPDGSRRLGGGGRKAERSGPRPTSRGSFRQHWPSQNTVPPDGFRRDGVHGAGLRPLEPELDFHGRDGSHRPSSSASDRHGLHGEPRRGFQARDDIPHRGPRERFRCNRAQAIASCGSVHVESLPCPTRTELFLQRIALRCGPSLCRQRGLLLSPARKLTSVEFRQCGKFGAERGLGQIRRMIGYRPQQARRDHAGEKRERSYKQCPTPFGDSRRARHGWTTASMRKSAAGSGGRSANFHALALAIPFSQSRQAVSVGAEVTPPSNVNPERVP